MRASDEKKGMTRVRIQIVQLKHLQGKQEQSKATSLAVATHIPCAAAGIDASATSCAH